MQEGGMGGVEGAFKGRGFEARPGYLSALYSVVSQFPLEWGKWLEETWDTGGRIVRQENVAEGVKVSTVFLALDQGSFFQQDAKPILFETAVFRNDKIESIRRCSTWEEAELGHAEVVEKVKNSLNV